MPTLVNFYNIWIRIIIVFVAVKVSIVMMSKLGLIGELAEADVEIKDE